jgi:cytoskeletal protein CcmA (bactofilin family)
LVFKGKLTAEEDLLIQGRVEGFIAHNATNLTIGVDGEVKGDIVATRLIVEGRAQGDVRASDAVIVEASARVYGNLFAPRVGLEDGATFKGTIDMGLAAAETASRTAHRKGASKDARSGQGEEFHGGKVNQLLESAGP